MSDIIKTWRQPELESWMRNSAVDAALVMDPPDPEYLRDARSMALAAPFRHRDKAATRGTTIHDLVEQYLSGMEPEIDDLDLLQSYNAATHFIDKYVTEVLQFERPVYNGTFQYAGTPDLFCRIIDGRVVCLDWKSGKRIYRTVPLQIAAYCNAEWADAGDGVTKQEVPQADAGWVIHIRPDTGDRYDPGYPHGYGVFEVPEPMGRPWRSFQAARSLYEHERTELYHMGRIL